MIYNCIYFFLQNVNFVWFWTFFPLLCGQCQNWNILCFLWKVKGCWYTSCRLLPLPPGRHWVLVRPEYTCGLCQPPCVAEYLCPEHNGVLLRDGAHHEATALVLGVRGEVHRCAATTRLSTVKAHTPWTFQTFDLMLRVNNCTLCLPHRFKAPKYKWGCFGFSWCLSVTIASVVLSSERSYLMSLVFLPILITDTFCCFSVLKSLQKPPPGDKNMMERKKKKKKEEEKRKSPVVQKEEGTGGERAESGRGESRSMKKAIINIVFIQVVLSFNYAPLIITVFLHTVIPAHTLKCQILPMSLAAAICCSYLQPLFYLHRLGFLTCSKRPVNTWKVRC